MPRNELELPVVHGLVNIEAGHSEWHGKRELVIRCEIGIEREDPTVAAVLYSCTLGLGLRFGILPAAVLLLFETWLGDVPMSADLSAWYASRGLIVIGLTLALA